MNKKKYLVIIIFTFCFTLPVHAFEMCTPTQEYLDYQKLSSEEKTKYQEPIFCSEIKNSKKTDSFITSNLYPKVYSSVTDSSYNSYTDGYTTVPKNQYGTGLCWNFAAISTVESNAIKKGIVKEDVIAQIGYTKFKSDYIKTYEFLTGAELDSYIKEASLIITHGGIGSLTSALNKKKKIFAMPRLSTYKEHINSYVPFLFHWQGCIIWTAWDAVFIY